MMMSMMMVKMKYCQYPLSYGDHPWRLRMDIPTNRPKEEETEKKRSAAELRAKNQVLSDSFGTTVRIRLFALRITNPDLRIRWISRKTCIYHLLILVFCQPWIQAKQRQKKQMGQNRLTSTAGGMESQEISNMLASTPQETPKPPKLGSFWFYLLIALIRI